MLMQNLTVRVSHEINASGGYGEVEGLECEYSVMRSMAQMVQVPSAEYITWSDNITIMG